VSRETWEVMSLIGSELNLELDFNSLAAETGDTQGQEKDGNDQATSDEASPSTPGTKGPMNEDNPNGNEEDDDDGHRPPTPKTGIESFFLGELPTHNVSAAALAQELKSNRHSHNSLSAHTDDFKTANQASCVSDHSSYACADDDYDEKSDPNLFSKDALVYSRELSIESEEPERTATANKERTMATTVTTTTPVDTTPVEDVEEPMNIDPAEKIYDTAKGVWGWGKGIIIFSPFMGIAEGIAGKMVETVGSSMEDVDSALTGKLQELDDGILNPAVKMVVNTVMGAAHKTEEFIKPIIIVCLKPIDFMIKGKPEEEAVTPPEPEVTAVAMN